MTRPSTPIVPGTREQPAAAPPPAAALPPTAPAGKPRRRDEPDAPAPFSNPVPAERRLPVRALKLLDTAFARVYHQTVVRRPLRLPPEGPAILICNHTSGLDPFLIQSVCPRVIVWMMAKEYYEIRALTWAFRIIEAIPVDRGGRDLASTRSALRALHAGRVLGVFPEGRIETTRDLLPFQTGVAMMAIKAGVPVYPAYLDGTQRGKEMLEAFVLPNRASLSFGPAVEFDRSSTSKKNLEAATEKFEKSIASLRAPVV